MALFARRGCIDRKSPANPGISRLAPTSEIPLLRNESGLGWTLLNTLNGPSIKAFHNSFCEYFTLFL